MIGATEGSLNPEALIDGTEATNWGGVTEGNVDATNPSVAVDLAGDVADGPPRRRQRLPDPGPGRATARCRCAQEDPDSGSRFTALRQFALEACTSACASPDATWTRFYTSPTDAFPGVKPRPVAPDLTLREFDVPDTEAAAVRLVTLHNQCTGGPDYAGEQDDDPLNDTDCATASDRGTIVHASELQVFTRAPPPRRRPAAAPRPAPARERPPGAPTAGTGATGQHRLDRAPPAHPRGWAPSVTLRIVRAVQTRPTRPRCCGPGCASTAPAPTASATGS